jgi:glycosyltransferase involved in cell wall biosynthesis
MAQHLDQSDKNILYIINCLSVGGAQKALLNLASSEFSRDYNPHVVALLEVEGLAQQFADAGIPIHVLGLNRWAKLPLLIPRLAGLVWRIKPTVIHGWMYHANIFAVLAWVLGACRPRLLWGIHHTPDAATMQRFQHALVIKLGCWLSALPQRIVYVSHRSMLRHYELGYVCQRAQVITNGIPLQASVAAPEDARAIRQVLGIPADVPLIGSLTRFVPAKDIPNLFAAIKLLQQRGGNAHFLLAGEGMSVDNPALASLLETLPTKACVHLLGVRKDASRLIALLDIATLSSQREAFPLFLAEAMAQAVPCVATDVGDIAECIADTGLVVPANNPLALAMAWETLLQQPLAERQMLGKQAQQRITARFGLDGVIAAYRHLLLTIMP